MDFFIAKLEDWELLRQIRLRSLICNPDWFDEKYMEEVFYPESYWRELPSTGIYAIGRATFGGDAGHLSAVGYAKRRKFFGWDYSLMWITYHYRPGQYNAKADYAKEMKALIKREIRRRSPLGFMFKG